MIFPAGQVIRFFGSDGEQRALQLAEEFRGQCIRTGNNVQLLVETQIGRRRAVPGTLPGVDMGKVEQALAARRKPINPLRIESLSKKKFPPFVTS